MNVQIRHIEPSDCSALLKLVKELAEFEKLTHTLEASETRFHDAFFSDSPSACALVAEDEGELVGYAVYFRNFSTFLALPGLYLEDLYVQPAYRARGLGKRFIQQLAVEAEKMEAGRMEWCVLDWNEQAIEFYRYIGADVLDEWRIVRVTRDRFAALKP